MRRLVSLLLHLAEKGIAIFYEQIEALPTRCYSQRRHGGLSALTALFSGVRQGENPLSYYDRVNLIAKIPHGMDALPWVTGVVLLGIFPLGLFLMYRMKKSGVYLFIAANSVLLTVDFLMGMSVEGPIGALFSKAWYIVVGLTIGLYLSNKMSAAATKNGTNLE